MRPRVPHLAARVLTAAVVAAFAALLALALQTLPLQAQTVTTLVSNTGQTVNTSGSSHFQAQSFVTGDNTGGYTITEVQIRLRTVTSGDTTTVKIKENNSGEPGNLVATLMNPATLTGSALNTFTAPANTTLDASTTYWISVNEGVSNRVTYASTNGDDETGWSIGNDRLWRASEPGTWTSEASSLILVIKGAVNTGTASDDATLSALTVNDGTNDLTLDPTFAPGTYVYAAEVGNAVTSVTLTATVNDDGAEISGVTLGGTAIADSDFTDGITVPSLIVGHNDLVVTVTAEDDVTSATYQVTVTRATANTAPTFDDGTSTSREFNETIGEATVTTASEIETPVAATDTDTSDTLEYTLSGTDAAKFTVDTGNGQIKTVVGETYDHEAKASYAVTVTVEDGNGGSATIDVTLNVTDQDEPPLRPVAPTVSGPSSNSTTSLRVTMTAPDNSGRPPITQYKVRAHRDGFGWSTLPYNSNSARTIANITSGKRYHVQFRVKNDEGEGPWSPTGFGYTKAHASGMPDISGTARVGSTLTAGTSGISDGNGKSKAENGDVGFAYTY